MIRMTVFRAFGLSAFLTGGMMLAQVTTGVISGTVKDASGGVLPGTQIVVLNEETGISRAVTTDSSGHYSATSLSIGKYRVTGTHEGFQSEVRSGLVLTVGREAVVDLTLAVGAVTQTVEVSGEAPLVESTSASLGSLVDDRTIRDLPLNGRSYDQLALLQPGVVTASPGIITATPYQWGTASKFSVGGQRDVTNLFLLDGTDINDQSNGTPGGAAGTNLGVDTIQEFKIFTNLFKAEYGHSSGSITSAITRSGTNTFHGTAFEYIRNSDLDARNFFDTSSSARPFIRNQFGGVFGGPIKRDKTFFFVGYEGLRQGQANTGIATVPNAVARQGILPSGTVAVNPIIVPYLALWPLPNGRDFGNGTAQFLSSPTTITNEDNFMIRIDQQLNAKTNIFARYTFDNDSLTAPSSLPDFLNVNSTGRQYITLQGNTIFSANALDNIRFSFNRTNSRGMYPTSSAVSPALGFVPGQPVGALQIGAISNGGVTTNIASLGSNGAQGTQAFRFNNIESANDFSYIIKNHTLKIGVDIERIQDNTQNTGSLRGTYTFTTLNTLLAGTPSSLQALAPVGVVPYWGLRTTLVGAYVQDDYTVNSRLTLNLGLRWEATTDPVSENGNMSILPSPAATSLMVSNTFFTVTKKNFEPRLGLAWRLDANGKTVLRAGAGIYHNQIMPVLYQGSIKNPPFFFTYVGTNPTFPNGYLDLASTGVNTLKLLPPFNNKTSAVDQYNISIERQIFKSTVVEVAYTGNKADHLQTQHDANPATPMFLPDGTVFYPAGAPRLNPAWGSIETFAFNADSVYNSVTFTLRRQAPSGVIGEIFYTFSKTMDEASSTQAGDSTRSPNAAMDPWDFSRDWGLSDYNQTNKVGVNFSYPSPFRAKSRGLGAVINGWTLNGIGTFASGEPFTARLSSSQSRDGSNTLADRPNLIAGMSQNPTQGVSAGCPGFAAGSPLGGPSNYFDPCAFSLPLAGTYGNLGRNTIIGPGIVDIDLSLEKLFRLTEKMNLAFRAEMFNVLNHANLGLPNSNALTSGASGAANPSAGVITYTSTSSRQLQFALRFNF